MLTIKQTTSLSYTTSAEPRGKERAEVVYKDGTLRMCTVLDTLREGDGRIQRVFLHVKFDDAQEGDYLEVDSNIRE